MGQGAPRLGKASLNPKERRGKGQFEEVTFLRSYTLSPVHVARTCHRPQSTADLMLFKV